jgi:hypothetical protein
MKLTAISLLTLCLLAACQTTPPPMTAAVRIPVPCVDPKDVPRDPVLMTEEELAALDTGDVPVALEVQRLILIAYARELKAIAEGCSRLPRQ